MTTYSRRQWLNTVGAVTFLPSLPTRATTSKPMRGAFMILSTPYTDANEVDYEDLAREVAFLDRCGVHGLVWPQNSSEQRYLSTAERIRGVEVLTDAARGRKPALVFRVQGHDIESMMAYARHAETQRAPPAGDEGLSTVQLKLGHVASFKMWCLVT